MRETCTSTKFRSANKKLADELVKAVYDLRQYWPLTVRQAYYQMVARLVVDNNHAQYRRVSRVLKEMRMEDMVPWGAFEDRTRRTTDKRGWSNVQEWLQAQIDNFARPAWYGRCYVQKQDVYVEVASEKDALSTIMEEVVYPFCTRLNVGRGHVSTTMRQQMAVRFDKAVMRGQKPILLYFGDFDASGVAIPRSLQRLLAKEHGVEVDVRRVALLPEHIVTYNLPTDPEAAKPSDPNYKAWLRDYGPEQPMVELDALHPAQLETLLREALESTYDMQEFAAEQAIEREERRQIKEVRNGVLDYLTREHPHLFREAGHVQ